MSYSCKNIFAALPKTQRGSPIVLGNDPKGVNFLYTNGNSVIIRNIENPAISDVYTEHSTSVLVAKYSPSRFYIASADQNGKVRIWDTVNLEHILKNEYQPFGGPIKDLAWSPDSQRIVVVGEGREKFGHVFMADTGTSVGEITGQTKAINSVDFKSSRPFKIVTGSEDNTIGIYEGPPFKFKCTKKDHTRYVQAVRYSPDGELFASGGFDGKVLLFNGKDSELLGEFGSPAHSGGVYGVAWSPDGKQLLTASGDKTCKLWDVESKSLLKEFIMGSQVEDQQVSCLWQGPYLLTVSLSGFITYLDVNNPEKPLRIIKGHNKAITVLGMNEGKDKIITGSHDGWITVWDSKTGENERVSGVGHGNQINSLFVSGGNLYTVGIDDNLKVVDLESLSYDATKDMKLGSQPRGIHIHDGKIMIVTVKELILIENGVKTGSLPIKFEPSSLSFNPVTNDVAVGSLSDDKVYIFSLNGSVFEEKKRLGHMGGVTDVSYSPNSSYLVASDAHRKVVVYSSPTYEIAHKSDWGFHTGRVNTVGWSPDSTKVASGSLDTRIIVWSMAEPTKNLIIKNAHPQSQITRVAWLDEKTIVSTGQDANTKIWEISNFP